MQPGKNPPHPTHLRRLTGSAVRRPKVVPTPRHTAKDTSQSKLYLTDISQWEEAGRAHGEVFGEIRSTLALVHVLPFLDPKMLVEIELLDQKSIR